MVPSAEDSLPIDKALETPPSTAVDDQSKSNSSAHIQDEEKAEFELSETQEAGPALLKWNHPRINMWRFFVTLLSFIIMGANDASYGALIPYLERYYGINYTIVSLVFLAPFFGYTAAAFLNNRIHMHFGQRGIAIFAPCCKIITYVVTCNHPPYPVLPIVFVFSGLGNGLQDGGWNAWVGGMSNANELMGILHGAYGLGATIAPLIATSMVAKANMPWYTFYYIMIGGAVIELIAGGLAFWKATASQHRIENARTTPASDEASSTREALMNPITWLVAVFLLGYVGIEVSLGGWLVEFMLKVRHGGEFNSGLVVTGYWAGITVGRVVLGFVTGRIGQKLAIAIYLLLCMGLELLFWLVPYFVSSAIFAALLGFFLGPLFPAAILVASKLLPRHLHVSAIGFAAAFGGGGAAALPFAVGAIAQAKGVKVLQPIVLAFLTAILLIWAVIPGGFRKRGLEEAGQAMERRRMGVEVSGNGEDATGEKFMTRMKRRVGLV